VGAFGEKLRKQRELRGVSLDAISTVTKISPRMLRAIEDEHFDQLPGGVFNKGFVRAYARQVGLDEEEAVSDYLAALRENQIHAQTILPNFRSPGGKSPEEAAGSDSHNPNRDQHDGHNHGTRLADSHPGNWPAENRRVEARRKETRRDEDREDRDRAGKGLGKDGLGKDGPGKNQFIPGQHVRDFAGPRSVHRAIPDESTAGNPVAKGEGDVAGSAPLSFLKLTPALSQDPMRDTETENPLRHISWEKLAAVLVLITLALGFWALRHRGQPGSGSQPATSQASASLQPLASPAAVLASTSTSPTSTSLPKPQAASHPRAAAPDHTAASPDLDVDQPAAKPQTLSATKNLPATFTLVIRAAQTSWVSISADGQPVAEETLIAPANTSVRATREIVVKAGNAAGISFLFNGKEIPGSGDSGEVRTYIFDPSGIRTSATLQTPNPGR